MHVIWHAVRLAFGMTWAILWAMILGAEPNPHRQHGERPKRVDAKGARRDQGEGARRAVERSSVDRGRGREGDRARTTDGQHDAVKLSKTGEVLKANRGYRLTGTDGGTESIAEPGGHAGHRQRVDILTAPPTLHKGPGVRLAWACGRWKEWSAASTPVDTDALTLRESSGGGRRVPVERFWNWTDRPWW